MHKITSRIEQALSNGNSALGLFLDIEGAFDNISFAAIREKLVEYNITPLVANWIYFMVSHRFVTLSMSGCTITRQLSRGAPQGGVLSPLLWNLTMNGLLTDPSIDKSFLQAFADDLAILIGGFDLPTMRAKCQRYLNTIKRWCTSIGVRLSALKSLAIIFTKKMNLSLDKPLKVDGAVIPVVQEVRYLGLILDTKLSWRKHAEFTSSKAMKGLHSVSSSCRKTWGLPPAYMRWIYLQVSSPSLLFGCVVWHHKVLNSPSLLMHFDRVHRTGLLMITGAFRSSPTASLEVLAGIRPINLMIERTATFSALRLMVTKAWICAPPGSGRTCHARNLDILIKATVPKASGWDMIPTSLAVDVPFSTTYLEKSSALTSYLGIHLLAPHVAYTDGSLKNGLAGAGAIFYSSSSEESWTWHLGGEVSVFQAELYAIMKICILIKDKNLVPSTIAICSDSQAAIKALNSSTISSQSVLSARQALESLCSSHSVSVVWTPAHIGIPGNEAADSLANLGSDSPPTSSIRVVPFSFSFIRGLINQAFFVRHIERLESKLVPSSLNLRLTMNHLTQIKYDICTNNKFHMRILAHLFTGHSYLRYFQHKIGHESDPYCRLCEEERETTDHFLSKCPATVLQRKETLGYFQLRGNYVLSYKKVLAFASKLKYLDYFQPP